MDFWASYLFHFTCVPFRLLFEFLATSKQATRISCDSILQQFNYLLNQYSCSPQQIEVLDDQANVFVSEFRDTFAVRINLWFLHSSKAPFLFTVLSDEIGDLIANLLTKTHIQIDAGIFAKILRKIGVLYVTWVLPIFILFEQVKRQHAAAKGFCRNVVAERPVKRLIIIFKASNFNTWRALSSAYFVRLVLVIL